MGSAAPVDLTGCQQACEMAQPDCDAVVFNPTLQACFLKKGPSTQLCQVSGLALVRSGAMDMAILFQSEEIKSCMGQHAYNLKHGLLLIIAIQGSLYAIHCE